MERNRTAAVDGSPLHILKNLKIRRRQSPNWMSRAPLHDPTTIVDSFGLASSLPKLTAKATRCAWFGEISNEFWSARRLIHGVGRDYQTLNAFGAYRIEASSNSLEVCINYTN